MTSHLWVFEVQGQTRGRNCTGGVLQTVASEAKAQNGALSYWTESNGVAGKSGGKS